tara:strand:- start:1904 stop:2383 length:480 start_codon:yes stop_codon:yes gene_type:complete
MNIECINCSKTFKVNSDLIPSEGRNLQCGSCNHIWFFNIKDQINLKKEKQTSQETFSIFQEKEIEIPKSIKIEEINSNKEVVKNKKYTTYKSTKKSKSNFRLSHFLSYILVLIISFIAVVVVVDTFKSPIFNIFPNLELTFYNLLETLKDISLFIKDLT